MNHNIDIIPNKIFINEKEREFFDCIRLIIQNGYQMQQDDIFEILTFIKIEELLYFPEDEQIKVKQFLKQSMEYLHFDKNVIENALELAN